MNYYYIKSWKFRRSKNGKRCKWPVLNPKYMHNPFRRCVVFSLSLYGAVLCGITTLPVSATAVSLNFLCAHTHTHLLAFVSFWSASHLRWHILLISCVWIKDVSACVLCTLFYFHIILCNWNFPTLVFGSHLILIHFIIIFTIIVLVVDVDVAATFESSRWIGVTRKFVGIYRTALIILFFASLFTYHNWVDVWIKLNIWIHEKEKNRLPITRIDTQTQTYAGCICC